MWMISFGAKTLGNDITHCVDYVIEIRLVGIYNLIQFPRNQGWGNKYNHLYLFAMVS